MQQPGRQAAKFPLGADVRPGSNDQLHLQTMNEFNELSYIPTPLQAVCSSCRLMKVPRNVCHYGVKTWKKRYKKS